MAEEVEMTPVAPEPPKANPLSGAAGDAPKTLKVPPAIRKPGAGATVSALRPGLKLPPKPGATVSALKPGLKLPPKPGATVSALKPGLKLPPARPVIHRPGTTAGAGAALPRPVQAVPPPVAPVAAKPAEAPAPVAAASKPIETPTPAAAKPVEAPKPAEASEPVKPMEQLKKITQSLKGITQPIPQQAVLHRTGIIADEATTLAQKEASKHKTARISLSEAIGVAPVKNENAPMKTIRIKRPIDIPGATASAPKPPLPKPIPAPAAADDEPVTAATIVPEQPSTSITQRKTLKIARPNGGVVRPAGRFGVKRPNASAPAEAAAPAEGGNNAAETPVADIADIPNIPDMPSVGGSSAAKDTTPAWLYTLSALVQAAACVGIGVLAWKLYEGYNTLFF